MRVARPLEHIAFHLRCPNEYSTQPRTFSANLCLHRCAVPLKSYTRSILVASRSGVLGAWPRSKPFPAVSLFWGGGVVAADYKEVTNARRNKVSCFPLTPPPFLLLNSACRSRTLWQVNILLYFRPKDLPRPTSQTTGKTSNFDIFSTTSRAGR